jgi:hypothetical protein
MMRTPQFLTLAALTATLALPAVAASSPSSASGSPVRHTSQALAGPIGHPLPYSVGIRRTGGPTSHLWQTINLFTDGQWRYVERSRGIHDSGSLGLWERRWLGQLMLDPALPGSLGYYPPPLGCGDAFRYTVFWLDNAYPESRFYDCGDPPAPLARLVHAVMDLTAF